VSSGSHRPVLLEEALTALNIRTDGRYVDGTFGRGGHSGAILARLGPEGRLLALDKDPAAVAEGERRFGDDPRFVIRQTSFAEIGEVTRTLGWLGKVDGILLDLGVSSPQLDDAERGFSFRHDGPLDMRMDPTRGPSAAEWLAEASEQEIARVLKEYGEERFARRIARVIVQARSEALHQSRAGGSAGVSRSGADGTGAGWTPGGDQFPLAGGPPGEALHPRAGEGRSVPAGSAGHRRPVAAPAARGGQADSALGNGSAGKLPGPQRHPAGGRAAGRGCRVRRHLPVALLALAVLASALGVVYAKHRSRVLFVQLNELQQQRDAMNVEWGQLQLELSTWANQSRIEQIARRRLRMHNVDFDQVVMIRP